ncbi:MAG: NAD(+) synthase [Peptococcaceae bacterium]|nr:NAD(+) synthase [Peptococcaceae bacterium]MDH7525023.1 NAD(+) synthase [Peptococcaceae bacterium]
MSESICFVKDWAVECQKICDSIRQIVYEFLKRDGVVIGLSGGIDSSVTAALCVRALGKDKVLGVVLPEKESSKESEPYAVKLAETLGINYVKKDITPILEQFGVYEKIEEIVKKYHPGFNESFKYKIVLPGMLDKSILNLYSLSVVDSSGNEVLRKKLPFHDYKAFQAALSIKLRVRMINLYYYSEKNNMAVAGTTNRSEFDLGNFCKYGDGGIDFEVISHLYKTQVYDLAKYLKIPEEIQQRTPSPDTCSAYVSDEEFFFSLPFDILDRLLYAHAKNFSAAKTAKIVGMEEKQVAAIFANFQNKKNNTMHIKMLPPACGSMEL